MDGDYGKASCRSVKGVDFGSKIAEAKLLGLVESGGGHAMAAGFTIARKSLDALERFLNQAMEKEYGIFRDNFSSSYDLELTSDSLSIELAHEMQKLAPFGTGNHEPIIRIDDLFVIRAQIVGDKHVSCILAPSRDSYDSKALKAIAFNAASNDIGHLLLGKRVPKMSCVGHLQINQWQQRENLQLVIHDIII
jgi:single-stranded-DNA-specific exonuclease